MIKFKYKIRTNQNITIFYKLNLFKLKTNYVIQNINKDVSKRKIYKKK